MGRARVVILGGGFAGVKCARVLRKRLPSADEVTLFNRENHMVFHPLLAEVAGGSINRDLTGKRSVFEFVRRFTAVIGFVGTG